MNDHISDDIGYRASENSAMAERVICVVARDVLSLDQRDADFGRLFLTAWRGRWLIFAFIVVSGLIATVYSLLATEWYVAETVLIPVSTKGTEGLAGQLGKLSMLTSIAGINLDGDNGTAESIGVLKSHDFARQFIDDQKLLHVLLSNEWDPRAHRWKESDPRRRPDIRDAIRYFDRNVLIVNEDKKTGLVKLGIRWKDPSVAASWANMIVDRLNAQMRTRALTEGETNIKYLDRELASTTQVTVQLAIAQLIETEMQKVMIARSTPEFAFRVIDHAEVPKQRSWPKRTIMVAVGVLGGGVAGLIAVFVCDFLRKQFSSSTRTE